MAATSMVTASHIESNPTQKEVSLQSFLQHASPANSSSVLRRAFSSDITSLTSNKLSTSSTSSYSSGLSTTSVASSGITSGATSVINRHASQTGGVLMAPPTAATQNKIEAQQQQQQSHQHHLHDGGGGGAVMKIAADSSDSSGPGGAGGNVHYVTDGDQIYATHGANIGHFTQYVAAEQNVAFSPFHHHQKPDVASFETTSTLANHLQQQQHSTSQQQQQQNASAIGVVPRLLQTNQLTTAGYGGMQGQLVTHQGNTYILQTSGGDIMESDGVPFHHMTRASPVTVEWLLENFEPYDGVSLARCTLYAHYLHHCRENNLDAMNAASFGKLIRSIFLGLKTRRLGARGNSKYHYYGIRVKPSSMLNQFSDNVVNVTRTIRGGNTVGIGAGGNANVALESAMGKQIQQQRLNQRVEDNSNSTNYMASTVKSELGATNEDAVASAAISFTSPADSEEQARIREHMEYLGTPSFNASDLSAILSEHFLPVKNQITLPDGISFEDLFAFESLYRDHCESILEVVSNLQFNLLESLWSSFWKRDDGGDGDDDMEDQLPKRKLLALCAMDLVQSYMRQCDQVFYQSLVDVLMPDVLRPIPLTLTHSIRNFAKNLENWASATMAELPEEAFRVKMKTIHAFSQLLRRYTSLNHLAQAARAVLQNATQILQMVDDLNRVDFKSIQEQAAWVCQCENGSVERLEKDFKQTLQRQSSLRDWALWLESVIDQVLKPHAGSASYSKAARQFLLKWSFYTSMVIRDLTLRSAASFGSFHLIRLLFDEFVFYLVERKVAASLGVSSVGVMETAGASIPRVAAGGGVGVVGGSCDERNASALRSGRRGHHHLADALLMENAIDGGANDEQMTDVAVGKRVKVMTAIPATTTITTTAAATAADDEYVTSTSSLDSSEISAWDSVITQSAVETILPS